MLYYELSEDCEFPPNVSASYLVVVWRIQSECSIRTLNILKPCPLFYDWPHACDVLFRLPLHWNRLTNKAFGHKLLNIGRVISNWHRLVRMRAGAFVGILEDLYPTGKGLFGLKKKEKKNCYSQLLGNIRLSVWCPFSGPHSPNSSKWSWVGLDLQCTCL